MLTNEVFIATMVNIANTLSWALLYLIHNPQVQETLHEKSTVLGKRKACTKLLRQAKTETSTNMKYSITNV